MNFVRPSGTDPVDRARKLGPAIEAAADEIECAQRRELSRHDGSVGWNTFAANSAVLIASFILPEMAETASANPCTAVMVAWRPSNDSKAIAARGSYSVAGIIALRCRASDLVVSAAA
jgi:hypothetical protein